MKTVKIDPFPGHGTQMCTLGKCHWSVARLIELSRELPVMEIPIVHMNIVVDIVERKTVRDFVMHMKSVLAADLDYPIILDEDGEIMDGRHRLAKALLEGRETIKAVRFEENPSPCRHDDD